MLVAASLLHSSGGMCGGEREGRRTWGDVGGSFLDQVCVAFSTKTRSLIKYYTFCSKHK